MGWAGWVWVDRVTVWEGVRTVMERRRAESTTTLHLKKDLLTSWASLILMWVLFLPWETAKSERKGRYWLDFLTLGFAAKNVVFDERSRACEWWRRVEKGCVVETSLEVYRKNAGEWLISLTSNDDFSWASRPQAAAGESSRISDPTLVRWTDEALNHILTSASSSAPAPLALYLRGDLSASGSFPSYRSKDAKSSFRDFEAAANAGYVKSWFRIGRAYEDFGDIRRAVGAYEKGVEKGDCGSTYRLAMAYLLGQIGIVADVPKAMALLKRAADTADLDTPQRECTPIFSSLIKLKVPSLFSQLPTSSECSYRENSILLRYNSTSPSFLSIWMKRSGGSNERLTWVLDPLNTRWDSLTNTQLSVVCSILFSVFSIML